jgi:LuxR family maltose regulon positive regulatory protein
MSAVVKLVQETLQGKDIPVLAANRFTAWKARAWIEGGNQKAVEEWIDERELTKDGEITYFREDEYFVFALHLIEQGRFQDAEKLLSQLIQSAEQGGRIFQMVRYLVSLAKALDLDGRKEDSISTIMEALRLAEPAGMVRTFINEGPQIAGILYDLLSKNIELDFIQTLLSSYPESTKDVSESDMLQTEEGERIEPLSDRELEVLQLMAEGMTNPQIGTQLFLSPHTVKAHARTIYGKLGVNNRTQAVNRARSVGILKTN